LEIVLQPSTSSTGRSGMTRRIMGRQGTGVNKGCQREVDGMS
jgi:hypothetical protein